LISRVESVISEFDECGWYLVFQMLCEYGTILILIVFWIIILYFSYTVVHVINVISGYSTLLVHRDFLTIKKLL